MDLQREDFVRIVLAGLEAQKCWRRLNGAEKLAKVITGIRFVDGIETAENRHIA